MPALLVLSGRKVVRTVEHLGWQVARQRGSHIVLVKDGEIAKGTLRSLIRTAGITMEAFISAL